jgi:ABC-type amino acid transport system permease subunit
MAIDATMLQSTEFLIPFLFSLAVIFGVLEVTRIFRNRAVNFIVAFTLSFFALIYPGFVDFMWANFGLAAIFFIAMFFLVFVFKVFGIGGGRSQDSIIINGIILLVLLSVSYLYIDSFPSFPYIGEGQNLILFISLVLILSIFWAAYKTESPPSK